MLRVNLDDNPGLTPDSLGVGDRRQGTARILVAVVAFAAVSLLIVVTPVAAPAGRPTPP